MPFGVELPANLGANNAVNDTASAAPESHAAPETISTESRSTETPNQSQMVDLDKQEKFRFKGRDWTRDEFEKGYLRQQDYTQKTQELTERRKYVDNFAADLSTVASDPSRMADFERMYPKEFVALAKTHLAKLKGQNPQETTTNESKSWKDDPEFQEFKSELSEWKSEKAQAEVKSIQTWLDGQFDSLTKKYPHAHTEIVNSRAEAMARQFQGTDQKITAQVLDKLFKENNDEMKTRSDSMYKTKITNQINAGKSARDIGPGGDVDGGAPKKFRTIKEATAGFLSDIANNR